VRIARPRRRRPPTRTPRLAVQRREHRGVVHGDPLTELRRNRNRNPVGAAVTETAMVLSSASPIDPPICWVVSRAPTPRRVTRSHAGGGTRDGRREMSPRRGRSRRGLADVREVVGVRRQFGEEDHAHHRKEHPVGTSGRGPLTPSSRALAMNAESAIAATSGKNATPVRSGEYRVSLQVIGEEERDAKDPMLVRNSATSDPPRTRLINRRIGNNGFWIAVASARTPQEPHTDHQAPHVMSLPNRY